MSRVLTGVMAAASQPVIKRGSFEFTELVFRLDDGQDVTWKGVSMDRKVAEALRLGEHATFYGTKMWSTLYGVRPDGKTGIFKSWGANPMALVISIGMIAMGLGTAPLVFPLIAFLAGVVGVFMFVDASGARARFRRDERVAAQGSGAVGA